LRGRRVAATRLAQDFLRVFWARVGSFLSGDELARVGDFIFEVGLTDSYPESDSAATLSYKLWPLRSLTIR
jgi:hypothetical protein